MSKERSGKTEENTIAANIKDGCKLNFNIFPLVDTYCCLVTYILLRNLFNLCYDFKIFLKLHFLACLSFSSMATFIIETDERNFLD